MGEQPKHDNPNPAVEPKFCRCRVCHEHFYADTVAEAHAACVRHAREQHPQWGDRACYCPD